MKVFNPNNSILPDDGSGDGNDMILRDSPRATKSISAIQGLSSDTATTTDAKETVGEGVPISNFDSLIASMESLNIKFFN